jgi:hypothetical protein
MPVMEAQKDRQYVLLDLAVGFLVVFLVLFLLITMGIRTHENRLDEECKTRLLALATAEQLYLVEHSKFTADLEDLRPFLEPGMERMPMVCPINGNPLVARVQGDRYKIVAPGTEFYIETGDPSW